MTNAYEIRGAVTVIYLDRRDGTVEAIIDTEDVHKVKAFPGTWYAIVSKDCQTFYVVGRHEGNSTLLHRYLMGPDAGLEVDHVNFYGLDNRKHQLKICTRSENAMNRRGCNVNNRAGHRGVYWHEKTKTWRCTVRVNGKRKELSGGHHTPEAAVAAIEQFNSQKPDGKSDGVLDFVNCVGVQA